jgi:hypothetical protein
MRWITVLAILLISNCAFSQSWSGSDNFNSKTLNTNLWKNYDSILGIPLSANFVKTLGAFTFYSTSSIEDTWGSRFWHEALPKNASWEATIEASIDDLFTSDANDKYIEGLITIAGNLTPQTSYYTHCLHRSFTNFSLVPNWQVNGAPQQEYNYSLTNGNVVLKIQYDANSTTLKSSFAYASDPKNFTQIHSLNVGNWTSNPSFYLLVGGYSWNAVVQSNIVVMDNFSIVPTGTNSNTTLVLQQSTNLINWSSLQTFNLYETNSKSFYRLQIQKQ